jgi:hypothetical protein
VLLARNGKTDIGRNGMFLQPGDRITTGAAGKATVLFRNGSKMRLFENSDFEITRVAEAAATRERSFDFELNLRKGSLRGNLRQGRQTARIRTPVVVIGVKGTVFRVTEEPAEGTSVAVTEGQLAITNSNSSVEVGPGQRVRRAKVFDELSEKLEDLPNQIVMLPSTPIIDFSQPGQQVVNVTLQMTDVRSQKNVSVRGPIYLESFYYNIRFPASVSLDSEGTARVPMRISPPRLDDPDFDGRIIVRAYLDSSRFDGFGEGSLVLKSQGFLNERKLEIDASSGEVLLED